MICDRIAVDAANPLTPHRRARIAAAIDVIEAYRRAVAVPPRHELDRHRILRAMAPPCTQGGARVSSASRSEASGVQKRQTRACSDATGKNNAARDVSGEPRLSSPPGRQGAGSFP